MSAKVGELIDSGKELDGKKLEYIIKDNGYEIHLGGRPWITQYDQYSKILIPDGTFEENCLKQIEEVTTPREPVVAPEDQLRADVDYIALMTNVDLSEAALS